MSMRRRSFTFEGLKFFERNREDLDFLSAAERFRAHNFDFIQKNVTDSDERTSLLMVEMHKDYTIPELQTFMYGTLDEMRERIWDSYKINPDANGAQLSKEKLFDKINGKEMAIIKLLLELEKGTAKKKTTTKAGP